MRRRAAKSPGSAPYPGGAPRSFAGSVLDEIARRLLRLPAPRSGYTVHRGLRAPMRDGCELAADVYRPTSAALGTILVRGPYGRSLPMALPLARLFAAQRYNVCLVSSRGTFGSGGEFDPAMTEADDGQDTVRWMVSQPWFSGTFATIGPSYLAYTQWALLRDPPPELAAAVVSFGPHDFARHVWGTGAFRLDFLAWSYQVAHQEDHGPVVGGLRSATNGRRVRPALDALPLLAAGERLLEGRARWYSDWVSSPDLSDPFWAPARHAEALERVRIPVLLIGGWQDIFLDQTIEQYRHLRSRGVDVALTIGPWSHVDAASRALPLATRETLDWLDERLAKRHSRHRLSPVRAYFTGAREWRELSTWPPETTPLELHLHPDGRLAAGPAAPSSTPSSFIFDPEDPTPSVGGPLLSARSFADDSDLASRADVLSFTGPLLESDLEVAGAPLLEVMHTSDNPHRDMFARVSEVDGDGRSHVVTEGYRRLDPAAAGGHVALELRHCAHRFRAGSSIRLLLAGGSHPQYSRNLGTGEDAARARATAPARHLVHHGRSVASRLVLPAVT